MRTLFALLLLAATAHAGTSVITGTVKDAQGNPINGTLVMRLPIPAQDPTTQTAIAPIPVTFQLVNGNVQGGAPLYDLATIQPQKLWYSARAYDTTGALVFYGNYYVTGSPFNIGAATPTVVTTSNISFANLSGGGGGNGTVTNPNPLVTGAPDYGAGTSSIQSITTELAVDAFPGADFGTQANAAIAALPSTGGTIRFSCKNYAASSTTIAASKNNVTIQGCGSQDASVFATGGTTLNFAAGVAGINVTGAFVQIRDLILVSADSTAGSDNGISLSNGKPLLWNVGAQHFGGNGIVFNNNTDRWGMWNVEASANFGDGFQFEAVSDDNIGLGQNLSAVSNHGIGYHMLGGGGNVFIDTHAANNTGGGWFVHAVDNYFYATYIEVGTGSSFIFDTGITLNTVVFNSFGLPTTYTDGGTNVKVVNGLNDALSLARSVAATSVSGTDTITITTSPAFTKQTQPGLSITFVPTGNNATTSVTAAINGLAALPVQKNGPGGPVNLAAGDLTNTIVAGLSLDPTSSFWILENPATASFVGGVPGALGDVLFSSGASSLQVDSGRFFYTNSTLNAPGLDLNSPLPGFTSWITGTGSIPIAANSQGLSVPTTVTKPAIWLFPPAPANGVMNYTSESDGVSSANYSSGGSFSGATGTTCTLSSFNNGCASTTATIALTGSNAIASGTALTMVGAGNSCTSAPTSATFGNGTATCSGTATLSSVVLGGTETSSILPVANVATPNAAVETNSSGVLDPSFTESPSIFKLEDNFCFGGLASGAIGQGWTSYSIGSAPVLAFLGSSSFPHICGISFKTAAAATTGQGGYLAMQANPGPAAKDGVLGDLQANVGWSNTWIFKIPSLTNTEIYLGLSIQVSSFRYNNGMYIRFDPVSPYSSTANSSIVCTTTQCTVTSSITSTPLPNMSITLSGVTCPTRSLNGTILTVNTNGTTNYIFNASGAAETCGTPGTSTSTAETTYKLCNHSSSGYSCVDTGVAADTNWHKIVISSPSSGSINYTLDGTTTNINTNVATSATFSPTFELLTDATAQVEVDIDYFNFIWPGLAR